MCGGGRKYMCKTYCVLGKISECMRNRTNPHITSSIPFIKHSSSPSFQAEIIAIYSSSKSIKTEIPFALTILLDCF